MCSAICFLYPKQGAKDSKLGHLVVGDAGKKLWADLCDEEDAEQKDRVTQAIRVSRVAEDIAIVENFLGSKKDIAEVYSPPRMTLEGKAMGLRCGFAFDLTVPDESGHVWGLHQAVMQKEGMEEAQGGEAVYAGRLPRLHSMVDHPKSQCPDRAGIGEIG